LSLPLTEITKKLYSIFSRSDANLVESNPLARSSDGKLIALDARLNIDGNALFKHPEFAELRKEFPDDKEMFLKDRGIHFVYVGGNVGLICVGAGMTMATMDLVSSMGGKPACFCDMSAGINPESMELAIKTVSSLEGVQSILLNMFGGITRMDEVAHSFVATWKKIGGIPLPIVIRLQGTNVDEGTRIVKEHGFEIFTSLYEAVKKAVELGA
jgi:succinyl-CoA synthetase beta subunit